jgi:hypothetical protein
MSAGALRSAVGSCSRARFPEYFRRTTLSRFLASCRASKLVVERVAAGIAELLKTGEPYRWCWQPYAGWWRRLSPGPPSGSPWLTGAGRGQSMSSDLALGAAKAVSA